MTEPYGPMPKPRRGCLGALAALALLAILAIAAWPAAAAAPKPVPYTPDREVVTETATANPAGELTTVSVECPAGKVPSGGGFQVSEPEPGRSTWDNGLPIASYPDGPAWVVVFGHDNVNNRDQLTAYAVCVNG